MEKLGRARVNFLRGRFRKGEDLHAEAWEIKNYRDLDLEALFQGLSHQGCDLDVDSFEEIAKEVETPEELAEKLELDEKGYLYIFELWRRLLDHRETISIFCDELDAVIDEYEDHPEENEEILGVLLTELVDILDANVEAGYKPKQILKEVSTYLANDIKEVLFRFISDQVDRGNTTLASELLDDLSEYLEANLWIDFLRLKLFHGATPEAASAMMARFLEKLKSKADIELYFHLLRYLIETGDTDLFIANFREALKCIKSEDHFLKLLGIVFDYFNRNDREREEEVIKELIRERKLQAGSGGVSPQDKEKIINLIA